MHWEHDSFQKLLFILTVIMTNYWGKNVTFLWHHVFYIYRKGPQTLRTCQLPTESATPSLLTPQITAALDVTHGKTSLESMLTLTIKDKCSKPHSQYHHN